MTSSFDPEGREGALLTAVPEFDAGCVLEVGVGDGRLTWNYAARARAVFGVDPDLASLGLLAQDLPRRLRRRVFPVGAASQALPFPSERFDAALQSWSL